MRTYEDLSHDERLALDEEGVAYFAEIELMRNGIAVPDEPRLLDVPVVNVPAVRRYTLSVPTHYGSTEILPITFDNEEDAHAAVALMSSTFYSSPYGQDGQFDHRDDPIQVCSVTAPMESVKKMHKSALDEASRIADENKTAQNEYNDLRKKADELTAPIWTDFWERRRVARKVDDVIETFKNYIDLANGDMEIAKTFLRKAYPNYYSETLEEAFDLVGIAEVQFLAASQS